MKKKCSAAVLLALCLLMLAAGALAAQAPAVVSLEVVTTLSGKLPRDPETFVVRLTAGDASTPMPGGQTGGTYDIGIAGVNKTGNVGHFPGITFDHVGVYTYTLAQIPGSDRNCTYDSRSYTLTVNVLKLGGHAAAGNRGHLCGKRRRREERQQLFSQCL